MTIASLLLAADIRFRRDGISSEQMLQSHRFC
jgi:hypothetical protein